MIKQFIPPLKWVGFLVFYFVIMQTNVGSFDPFRANLIFTKSYSVPGRSLYSTFREVFLISIIPIRVISSIIISIYYHKINRGNIFYNHDTYIETDHPHQVFRTIWTIRWFFHFQWVNGD